MPIGRIVAQQDWSSQYLVETLSPPRVRGRKLLGTDTPDMTVTPSRTVEGCDVRR